MAKTARKFHFLREIAAGGFGSVYLAKVMHNDGFSRLAAVKLLQQEALTSPGATAGGTSTEAGSMMWSVAPA